MLKSKLIAMLTATAIAATSLIAAPAAAGERDNIVGPLIFGVAGVLLLKKLNDRKKERAASRENNDYRRYPDARNPRHEYDRGDRWGRGDRNRHHRDYSRNRGDRLPQACLREHRTRHGVERYYSEKCLKRHRRQRAYR